MENVSQKEKIILYILILLLLGYGLFMLLVKPAIHSKNEVDEKNQSLQISQENMSNYIANKAQYKKSLETAQNNLNKSVGNYYDILTTDQIDDVLTAYVLGSSISPNALSISIIDKSTIDNYKAGSTATTAATTTTTSSSSGTTAKSSEFKVACISLSVVGPQSNLMSLLNTLETDTAIYINNYTLNHDAADDSKSTLNVSLLLFMCGTEQ